MQTYSIEVTHVDAANDLAEDYMTEWILVEAASEQEAFDKTTARFAAIGRAVTAQEIF